MLVVVLGLDWISALIATLTLPLVPIFMRVTCIVCKPHATLIAQSRTIRFTQRSERERGHHRVRHNALEIEAVAIEIVDIFLHVTRTVARIGVEEQSLQRHLNVERDVFQTATALPLRNRGEGSVDPDPIGDHLALHVQRGGRTLWNPDQFNAETLGNREFMPSLRSGVKTVGIATDARIASIIGPDVNHTSR